MKQTALLFGLLLLTASACAASHLPKKPAPTAPVLHDIECVVRLTAEPKVVGALYASRNGTEYFVVQFDRNNDQHPDLVLFYPRVDSVQYRPFPTLYWIDNNLDGTLDLEYRDAVGDGLCQHFSYEPLKHTEEHQHD